MALVMVNETANGSHSAVFKAIDSRLGLVIATEG